MATGLPKSKWSGKLEKPIVNLESADCFNGFIRLWPDKDIDYENCLYYGDNLHILKALTKDKTLKGQVRLVYIDPPYSTNSIFQTRSLDNGYADLLKGNEYLDFLKERLILLHELLADDGSIYVHLDKNMAFNVKVLMDEIFGSKNFKNFIVRQKCRPKNYTKKSFGNVADYILFYTKTANATWNKPHESWTDEKILKEYPFIEPRTGRRYKRVPLHAPGIRNGATGQAWRGMLPPKGKHWQFTPQKLEQLDSAGKIYWSKNCNPRRKVYLDESKGISVQDIWLDFLDTINQNTKVTGYPTEKNLNLIKRIIAASSNEGDIVLDCFVGSGTTLEAASNLKRRWIGVDIEKVAIETILKRFVHGTKKMGDYVNNPKTLQSLLFNLKPTNQITDFVLFAEPDKANDLLDIIANWEGWIK